MPYPPTDSWPATWLRSRPFVAPKYLALLPLLALSLSLTGCTSHAVSYSSAMRMIRYASLGPVRDSAHPALAFPVIDLFSPTGQLLYHTYSIANVTAFLQKEQPTQPPSFAFPTDTLADIAKRYDGLGISPAKLRGRYTLLFISAPKCHACELQEDPLDKENLPARGINQISLTLTFD